MNIENRSKELASGFIKQAALNWKQPVETYLGAATSGGLMGGLIGSGIGGIRGAVRAAKAAEPGFGSKIKAGLQGGFKGGLRGGLLGSGIGTGLGALQTPLGMIGVDYAHRGAIADNLKKVLSGKEPEYAYAIKGYPNLMKHLTAIGESEGGNAAIEALNKIKDVRSHGQFSPVGNFTDGIVSPIWSSIIAASSFL